MSIGLLPAVYHGHVEWKMVEVVVVYHSIPIGRRRSTPALQHWFSKPYSIRSKLAEVDDTQFLIYFQLGVENNQVSKRLTEVLILRYDTEICYLVNFRQGDEHKARSALHR